MPIEAVIFDMDGLILDTEPLYRAAWQQASAAFGYNLSDLLYSRLIGRTRADAENLLLEEFGIAFPLVAFRTSCRKWETKELASGAVTKHGLNDLLTLLESRHVRKAVATSTERPIAISLLESAGVLNRFDAVTTGDEVTNGKPSPDLFLLAASRLGVVHTTCLVLEDAAPGVIAAHSAGMQVFIVPDQLPLPPSIERLASGVFNSLEAVAQHLEAALPQHPLTC